MDDLTRGRKVDLPAVPGEHTAIAGSAFVLRNGRKLAPFQNTQSFHEQVRAKFRKAL
jgi:hypothetical protein